jgi:hypothetical protein
MSPVLRRRFHNARLAPASAEDRRDGDDRYPHYWRLAGTVETVLTQVGYLVLFAVIFFTVARWRLRFN